MCDQSADDPGERRDLAQPDQRGRHNCFLGQIKVSKRVLLLFAFIEREAVVTNVSSSEKQAASLSGGLNFSVMKRTARREVSSYPCRSLQANNCLWSRGCDSERDKGEKDERQVSPPLRPVTSVSLSSYLSGQSSRWPFFLVLPSPLSQRLLIHRDRLHQFSRTASLNKCDMHRFNCKLVDFTLFARPLGYTVASTCNIVKYTWLLLFVLFFSQVSSQARHPSHQLSSRSSPSHQRLHGHQQDHRHFLHRQHGPGSPLASYSPFPPPSRDPFLQHHFSLLPASSPYRQSPLSRPPLPPPPPPPHHTGHSHPSLQHQYPHPLHGGYSGAPPRTPSYSPSYGPSYHSDPSPDAAVSPASVPSIVRHPGTCTFQRSQPACTFSLLCYLAGGLPVEGCENNIGLTCCMLNSQSKGAFNVNPQSHLLAPPSVGHHVTRETGLEPSSPAPPSPPPPAPQPITPTAGPSSLAPLNNGFHSTPSGDNVLPHVAGREHHQTLLSPEKQAGSGNSAGELNNGGGSGSGSSHFSPLAGAGGSSYQPSNHLTSGQSPYLTSSYQEFPAYPPNSQSPVSSAYSYDSFAYGLDHHSKSKQEPGSQFSPTVASVKSYHTIGETSSPPLQSSAVKMSSFAGASHAPAAATPGAASFSSHSLSLSGSPGSSALAVSSHQSQVPPSTAVAPAGVHALPSDLTSSSHSSTTQALASPSLVPPSTSSLSLSSSLSVQSPVSSTPHSLSLSSTGSPILFSSSFDESPVTDNAVRRTIPGNSIDVNDLTDSDLSSPARPTRPEDGE